MEHNRSHEMTQEQKENPNPGSNDGILATFTQICKKAVYHDWAEETGCNLEKISQLYFVSYLWGTQTLRMSRKHIEVYSRRKTFMRPKNMCLLRVGERGSKC